jgi:drug/metabolite transporter (DMT)-like permease
MEGGSPTAKAMKSAEGTRSASLDASNGIERRARLVGILLILLSTLIFGINNAIAKYLTDAYPNGEALAVRASFALLLLLPFLRLRDLKEATRTNPLLHLARMLSSAVEIACFYWSVSLLQLAEVSTFYLASPILVTAISALVLKEPVGAARWAATLVGFAGVLVALRPSGDALSWPALLALTGSFLYAVFLAITRRVRHASSTVLVASQLAALSIAGMATLPFAFTPPTLAGFAMMAAVGVIGVAGYFCVNRGLQLAPASVVAPFQYLSIIWAIILGYLAFGDTPGVPTLLGAGLIVAAGGFILHRERRSRTA